MTRRAYYTCPLQTAYMAKEFGCQYVSEDSHDFPERAYIHPDSMEVFEPQEGDFAFWNYTKEEPGRYTKGEGRGLYDPYSIRFANYSKFELTKIIQRQGKPFFWPEWQ